ncbi:hypothetical protein GGR34_003495 [Microvirga flocculans]|uniref:Uncharacterized protein n=1 Tax=Microvirga flocculans TaxID=217168 RepID=A0A7W6II65_9HYPH|nr:hypothetical protein [Microvirga flocculans]
MLGISLKNTYYALHDLGLVRSKYDYCRRFLGRGPTYLKDYDREGRDVARVPSKTVTTLRTRLCAIAERVPAVTAAEIMSVVQEIDRACQVADLLCRGR